MADRNGKRVKALILKACPRKKGAAPSLRRFASEMGMSRQAVYKWIDAGMIPADRAQQIVTLSEGRVSHEDLRDVLKWHDRTGT